MMHFRAAMHVLVIMALGITAAWGAAWVLMKLAGITPMYVVMPASGVVLQIVYQLGLAPIQKKYGISSTPLSDRSMLQWSIGVWTAVGVVLFVVERIRG